MPIYLYACRCGKKTEVVKPIRDLDRKEHCSRCGFAMQRQLTAPAVVADYAGYSCPVTGKWIEGRKAHLENLKRTGCRIQEPGEKEAMLRRKAAEDAALDSAVEATVEEFIEKLPEPKKAQLSNELESGLTAQVVRA